MPFVGFEARLADGRVIRECDAVWDAVPDGVRSLALVEDWQRPVALVEATPDRQVFCYNEAAAHRGGMGFLVAKGIGYIERDRVVELRFEIMPSRAMLLVQGALRELVRAADCLRRVWPKFLPVRRVPIVAALDAALEALAHTETDPRTVWRSYPASEFRLLPNVLRRGA
jgi:hypothetical protein